MINLDDCIKLGLITRPHSYKGQLILKLNQISFDDIIKMEWVFVIIDGLPVPFFVEEYSDKSPDTLIIKLEDIYDEGQAKEFSNKEVYISKTGISENQQSIMISGLIFGYEVIDKKEGYIGDIDTVIESPFNPLIRIVNKPKEILLPLNEDFILNIDEKEKKLYVDYPEGLLDLN